MKNTLRYLALSLTLLCPLATAATQSAAPSTTPLPAQPTTTAQDAATPQTITLTKISDQTLSTQRLIEKLKPVAAQPLEFEELNDKLVHFKKQLTGMQEQTNNIINDRKSSIDQIRASQSQWRFIRDQLTIDQQKIRDRGAELENSIAQLTSDEQNWKQIQLKVKDTPELNYDGDNIKTSLNNIAILRKQLSIPLQEAITLEQEWQELIDACDDAQTSLKNDESFLRNSLLSNIQSPIWEISKEDFYISDIAKQSVLSQVKMIGHYSLRYTYQILSVLIIMMGIVFFLQRLHQYNQRTQRDQIGIGLRLPLLEKPISAVIASTAFFALLILPYPPQLLKILLSLMLFVPVIRLGMPRLPTNVIPLAWLVSCFFIINELSILTVAIPALQRLWIFGSAIIGFIGCVHALTHAPKTDERKSTLWRTLRSGIWLAMLAALASMIGDILGAVLLSQFIITGVAYSTYAGLCLVVLAGILNDIVVAALYMPASEFTHIISNNRSLLIRQTKKLTVFSFFIFWLYFALSQFALWDGLVLLITAFFSHPFQAGSISVSIGDILSVVLTIWISLKLSRFLRFILMEDIAPRTNMVRGVPEAISTLMQYFILLIGFIVAIGIAGIDVSKFAIMAGALGVGIGIGLQDVVNNFTSGLILLFEQNIKQADTIQCGAINGKIMHIGMRCSIIRTSDGAEVIVPNGKLASDQVINWTRSSQERRITVPLSTTQQIDPNKVIETLLHVAQKDRDIIDTPAPTALLLGFGAGTMNFELRAWVNNSEALGEINSRLCSAIANAFAEAGILIPFQQQDVYIKQLPIKIQ